jgi:hypothetical protein
LLKAYRAEQQPALTRLKETAIADLPQVNAWRRNFTGFGANSTQHYMA